MFACVSWTLLWLASTQSTFQTFFRCSRFSEFDRKTFIFKCNVCKLNFSKRLVTFSGLSHTNQSILSHLLIVLLHCTQNQLSVEYGCKHGKLKTASRHCWWARLYGTTPKLLTNEWNFSSLRKNSLKKYSNANTVSHSKRRLTITFDDGRV